MESQGDRDRVLQITEAGDSKGRYPRTNILLEFAFDHNSFRTKLGNKSSLKIDINQ